MVEGGAAANTIVRHRVPGSQGVLPRGRTRSGHTNRELDAVVQNVFTLGGCLPIVGAQVISSSTEEDMLLKWRTFVHASDADIFTGYNVQVIFRVSCVVHFSSFAATNTPSHANPLRHFVINVS